MSEKVDTRNISVWTLFWAKVAPEVPRCFRPSENMSDGSLTKCFGFL